jgi:nucleolin
MLPIRQIVARTAAASAAAPTLSAAPRTAAVCRIAQALALRAQRHPQQQQPRRTFSQTRAGLRAAPNPEEDVDEALGDSYPEHEEFGRERTAPKAPPKTAYSSIDKKRSVFVGNVALELSPSDLREIFNEYGPVTEVVKGIGGAHWFVYFPTEEDAMKVIEHANGLFVRGRQMRVQPRLAPATPRSFTPTRERPLRDPTPTLFIGNMPYNMTDQDLNDLSKQLEYCFDIRVAIDRHTGWPRGYAHADFYTVGLATRALNRLVSSNAKMGTNTLRFDYASTTSGASNAFNISRLPP